MSCVPLTGDSGSAPDSRRAQSMRDGANNEARSIRKRLVTGRESGMRRQKGEEGAIYCECTYEHRGNVGRVGQCELSWLE